MNMHHCAHEGDYNPLHVDPDSSEAFGYDKPILHGLCSLGFSLRHVMRACCDNDPAQISSFKARFSKPVFPGQTLVTRMWRVSAKDAEGQACIRVVFETRVKETDAVCMNQCYVDLKSASTLASKL